MQLATHTGKQQWVDRCTDGPGEVRVGEGGSRAALRSCGLLPALHSIFARSSMAGGSSSSSSPKARWGGKPAINPRFSLRDLAKTSDPETQTPSLPGAQRDNSTVAVCPSHRSFSGTPCFRGKYFPMRGLVFDQNFFEISH